MRRAFADLVQTLHGYAHVRDGLGRAARGHDAKAVVVQALAHRDGARLVGVGNRDEGRPVPWQRQPSRGLRLREGAGKVASDPHHLAGGAHLHAQQRVGALEAVERQHRLLHGHVIAMAEAFALARQPQLGDPRAQHDAAGELRERQADGL